MYIYLCILDVFIICVCETKRLGAGQYKSQVASFWVSYV